MSVVRIYTNTTPTLVDTIVDEAGVAVDLTGATATLVYRPDDNSTPEVNLVGTPDPDQALHKGVVRRLLDPPLSTTVAAYQAWWHVEFANSTILDTPNFALVVQDHGPDAGDDGAGPCLSWIGSDDVAALPGAPTGVDFSLVAQAASELLYQWSGRQFPYGCTRTVRPCRTNCSCWLFGLPGAGYRAAFPWSWGPAGGFWLRDERPAPDGCGYLSIVPLPGWVTRIVSVSINGVVLDPSLYRLDYNRQLVGLYDALGNPVVWPACQDMRAGPGDAGSFVVEYEWGKPLPAAAKAAAAALALQIWNLDYNPEACKITKNVRRLVRQGVTIERDDSKATLGIPIVDSFLAAYNPTGKRRASAVWSPDLPRYPRRTA